MDEKEEFILELIQGFDPVVNEDTRVLILGSHPGVQSLGKGQYYANPGNAFWRIMFSALEVEDPGVYSERLNKLLSHGVGLWNVYDKVERKGSLDSNIKRNTLNDFEPILDSCDIQLIIASGKTPYHEIQKHPIFQTFEVMCLLSTSGLNNGREQERMAQWQQAIKYGLSKGR